MTAMQPPQPLSLALFELAAELHRSGSGAVFEATDVRSGSRVAIKRKDSSELGERKLLEHEAVLLATLSHPNVAVCLGSFVERGRFYMVLEFVLCCNLRALKFPMKFTAAWPTRRGRTWRRWGRAAPQPPLRRVGRRVCRPRI